MTLDELQKLTPEQKRVKIAEACGKHHYLGVIGVGYNCTECGKSFGAETHIIPFYLHDLNAMHEAEKTLTADQAWQYNRHLSEFLGTAAGIGSGTIDEWSWHATAAQRADAFLLTLP